MDITTYTSFDQIRAVLGVVDDELTNATIGLEVYASGLAEDLLEIGETLEADYAAVAAVTENVRTPKQQRLYRTVRGFATFSMGKRVGTSLSMFGPKDITDGKAGVTRFSTDPYKATMKNVEAEYGLAKQRLTEAYGAYGASLVTAAPRSYLKASAPTFNPVTGV